MTLSPQEARQQLRKITEIEVKRLANEKYRYYEPTGVGEQFIDRVGSGEHFITLFSAANGVGKTTVGANLLSHLFWPVGNKYFQAKLFKDFPFPKKGRIVSDPTTIEQTIIPSLKEWFPKGRYTAIKGRKAFEAKWTTDTGWEFDLMTYDQDVKEFESVTLGFAWFDEPPPEAIFKATVSRMRRGGVIFITATPLTGSAWMYDHILANPDKELAEKGQRTYVEADVETACIEHGVRGFLRHADIEKMIAEYSEDEKLPRVHGKFAHLAGLIFKRWSRKIHVIKPFQVSLREFSVYHALDTHPRNPDAAMWLAVDRVGRKFVVDELYIKATTSELAARLKSKMDQYRVERKILEPNAFIVDQHDEMQKSLADRLNDNGLYYLPATKQREQSDKRIGDALEYTMVETEMLRAPELYVFETCPRTIYEIEHYRWDDWTGKTAEKKSPKEKPVDKDDHMIECLGRILIQDPVFVPYEEHRDLSPAAPNYDPFS